MTDFTFQPPSNELNLDQPLFIGGFKDRNQVSPMSGVLTGLKGAIQRLIINGVVLGSCLSLLSVRHRSFTFFLHN